MPIDFFVNNCKTNSSKIEFGLCDDAPPASNPAYIDENDNSKWIGVVRNKNNKNVDFIAIDACIDIRKSDGKLESRCDGLLSFEKDLIFVELKCREGGSWLKKSRVQLTITVNKFKENYNISDFKNVHGNVCNSSRPISHSGHAANIQQFYDETNLVLKSEQIIEL